MRDSLPARGREQSTGTPNQEEKEMDEQFKTHGAVSWTELLTTDPAAAQSFYGDLFGWTFEEMSTNATGPYHVFSAAGKPIGGIMQKPPEAEQMPPHWGSYVTVDDIDAVAEKAVTLGGQILFGPMDIPKVGRFAVVQDPQGAVISIITYQPCEE
jgi:hypothetical protein